MASSERVGELLLKAGAITQQILDDALAVQTRMGGRIGRILVEAEAVDEDTLTKVLALQLGIPVASLSSEPTPAIVALVPRDIAERYAVFPVGLRRENGAAS